METPEALRPAWPLLAVFTALSVFHLLVVAADVRFAVVLTKPLLVPVLLAWFLRAAAPGWLRTTVAVGLAASVVGDVALLGEGDGWFLAGIGAFLLAQIAYAVGFVRHLGDSIARRRPLLVVPYLVALLALLVLAAPDVGALLLPVVVYGAVIIAMAVLATGVSPVVAFGAVLFVVSDALILLTSLTDTLELPASGVWVMGTYLAAQASIAIGVAARTRRAATSAASPP